MICIKSTQFYIHYVSYIYSLTVVFAKLRKLFENK